jgi:poly(A) polymerase/tRNA nucleotidyltransferase (CCA-adding enzyme)
MQALALPAGPAVGRLLRAIEEAQAEGSVHTAEEALALARRLIRLPAE